MSPSLLHGGKDTSGFHNILSTSIIPFDVGGISLLEDGDGLSIDDKLPILSLDCAFEFAMSKIILEHVDHIVEVNGRIIDGDNIHFARVKSSPGDQVPNMAKSTHSNLHHPVSGLRLALTKKTWLSVERRSREPSYIILNLPLSVLYLPIMLPIPCTFSPFSPLPLPADNPLGDLQFCDSISVPVVCLVHFFLRFSC